MRAVKGGTGFSQWVEGTIDFLIIAAHYVYREQYIQFLKKVVRNARYNTIVTVLGVGHKGLAIEDLLTLTTLH